MGSQQLQLPTVVLPAAAGVHTSLDPAALDAAAEAAEHALLRQGHSANTARSYRSALRYWAAWFQLRYGRVMAPPVAATTVVQFIVDHAQRLDHDGRLVHELPPAVDLALVQAGFKAHLGAPALSTLLHRVAVLSKVHRVHALDNPCEQPRVRDLLARTRRAYAKRGERPRKAEALTRDPLEALLATCDGSLTGLRDRALLLFAFASGGRRRSEVAAATVENTRRQPGGTYVFELRHSKGNPQGQDRLENHKPVVGRAAAALSDWLAASRITAGPIFRRVRRGGRVGEPLAAAAIRDVVRKRSALAGLHEAFTAHSLRAGFVTEACRNGIPIGETMALTGHRSSASLIGYFRPSPQRALAAGLLDGPLDPHLAAPGSQGPAPAPLV